MADRVDRTLAEQSRDLLEWFDNQQRDLPWRRSKNPYPVWVSEIMLQQTRVETVRPYFERFIEVFPSVEALAAADVEAVLSRWSGLGYYQRARRLHAAARQVVDEGAGFPASVEGWRRLPGIGRYTAAAITSIVLAVREPAVDGNVMRVVARLLTLEEDPKKKAGSRVVEVRARELLDRRRPGDSNQAMMELGATICRPRKPHCNRCPLENDCLAAASGKAERYPISSRRTEVQRRQRRVLVVEDKGRLLLFRRARDSPRLAGIWELPWTEGPYDGTPSEALKDRYGGIWAVGATRGRLRHSVTNRSFQIEVVEATLTTGHSVAEGPEAGWFSRSELAGVPLTGLVAKVLKLLDG